MTNPDFRALCAELLQPLAEYDDANPYHDHRALIARTRAALAQPEPVAPTDEELTLVYAYAVAAAVGNKRGPFKQEEAEAAQLAGLRAVLARWGTPAIQPVPVSERLPGPEDCDAEGRCWMFDPCDRGQWCYREALPSDGDPEPFTHWLPVNATLTTLLRSPTPSAAH